MGYYDMQYILKEPAESETTMSSNSVTNKLLFTAGESQRPGDKYVYVYDGYWQMSRLLYDGVQKANWDDVILNEDMKKTITELMHKFFDSEDIYKDLGVPWKRGVSSLQASQLCLADNVAGDLPRACGEWENHLYQSFDAFALQEKWKFNPESVRQVGATDL